jgi:hypothetical protein
VTLASYVRDLREGRGNEAGEAQRKVPTPAQLITPAACGARKPSIEARGMMRLAPCAIAFRYGALLGPSEQPVLLGVGGGT